MKITFPQAASTADIASPWGYHPIDTQFSLWKALVQVRMNAKTDHIKRNSVGRISEESMTLWMVKESEMKNKVELRKEREIDIAKAFIGVSPIRNQVEKVQDGNKRDEFL